MNKTRPEPLRIGDEVGIISPSWCGSKYFPHRFERGIDFLKSIGLKTIVSPSHSVTINETFGNANDRAIDINNFFCDTEIKAIFVTIGGVYCNEILPFIDYKLAKNNPKIVIGYSDATSLLLSLYQKSDLMTFYGPMLMTQFAEYPTIMNYTLEYFNKAIFSKNPIGQIIPSTNWTDERLDWGTKSDLTRSRRTKSGTWEWLKKGQAKGKILGGCFNTISRLKGTNYLPNFDNTILFWEIPEGVKPKYMEIMLTDLLLSDTFLKVKGMVVGRPSLYSKNENLEFRNIILNAFEKYNFPILSNVNFGHTDPILTIPIGAGVELNSNLNLFAID